jgi:hypothetical protein
MVRTSRVCKVNDEPHHAVTRLGLMNASLVGVGVPRQAVKSAEQDLLKVQMMKMRGITTVC